jgi:hypothetical protein
MLLLSCCVYLQAPSCHSCPCCGTSLALWYHNLVCPFEVAALLLLLLMFLQQQPAAACHVSSVAAARARWHYCCCCCWHCCCTAAAGWHQPTHLLLNIPLLLPLLHVNAWPP